ncbi:DUF2079 domain-containing protein [Leptolyngbya ohadii]|uniref:DUF2079 domain-containing protein n=1 Tax=Leptolyngbya ohadii TaxID=1962290 RepID=UPI0019D4B23A|nr:DUF2079 domain-containing protein [Leptolyngbya ohadii]
MAMPDSPDRFKVTLFDASSDDLKLKDAFKLLRSHFLTFWISGAALVLFVCSSVRHLWFKSTGFDLGIYDQVVYLMSRGLPPISSYLGFHHMGNHSAYSVYPIALLYWIYPSVYWLLGVQAICLALGALPTWLLARQAGLSQSLSSAMAGVYLLYPLIFNLNLFDFHPEVMALPLMLGSLWAARAGKRIFYSLAILFVLGCKASLSLTIAAMGVWLLVFEKRRFFGIFALAAGVLWFLLTTQWIIPGLSGSEPAAIGRYGILEGDSVLEMAVNLFLKPGVWLEKVFSIDTVRYLAIVLFPVIWNLSPRHMAPLVSTIPIVTLNILSANSMQRELYSQYSLPVLPFLLLSMIDTLAVGEGLVRQRRWILLWSLIGFLWMGQWSWFTWSYKKSIETWAANREAIALIPKHEGAVVTDDFLSPHLSHRPQIFLFTPRNTKSHLKQADFFLFNLSHLNTKDMRERANKIFRRVKQDDRFELIYERDRVYLFKRQATG